MPKFGGSFEGFFGFFPGPADKTTSFFALDGQTFSYLEVKDQLKSAS